MRALALLVVLWLVSPAQAQDITTQPGAASATPGWTLKQPPPPSPPPPQHDHTGDIARASYGTANIYVTSRSFGGTIIHIDGPIDYGDEKRFADIASRYAAGTV